jgi:hypothetical protein
MPRIFLIFRTPIYRCEMVSSTIVLVYYDKYNKYNNYNIGISDSRLREAIGLSDIGQKLNISNQWISDSQKTNGCPALCCPCNVNNLLYAV